MQENLRKSARNFYFVPAFQRFNVSAFQRFSVSAFQRPGVPATRIGNSGENHNSQLNNLKSKFRKADLGFDRRTA